MIETICKGSSIVKDSWKRIFLKHDPFGDPFRAAIQERMVLFPTYGFYLGMQQYDALIKTLKDLGEKYFFLSITEDGEIESSWKCYNPLYGEYCEIPHMSLELSIFSEFGSFGIMISHEDHAMIGGTKLFIETFKKYYPFWVTDRDKLRSYWIDCEKKRYWGKDFRKYSMI